MFSSSVFLNNSRKTTLAFAINSTELTKVKEIKYFINKIIISGHNIKQS